MVNRIRGFFKIFPVNGFFGIECRFVDFGVGRRGSDSAQVDFPDQQSIDVRNTDPMLLQLRTLSSTTTTGVFQPVCTDRPSNGQVRCFVISHGAKVKKYKKKSCEM